jgi:hypothetical protein
MLWPRRNKIRPLLLLCNMVEQWYPMKLTARVQRFPSLLLTGQQGCAPPAICRLGKGVPFALRRALPGAVVQRIGFRQTF